MHTFILKRRSTKDRHDFGVDGRLTNRAHNLRWLNRLIMEKLFHEMVIVIGREAKNVSESEAASFVFGVTAGNDLSERDWQSEDLQWFRAKGSDTFGPVGPAIARGLDHNDLLLQTRVNGEVRQSERTGDLLFDVEAIVSYVSRYVTLLPGDIIFTGTPGSTQALEPGDVVEVELEGVGVLRNPVVAGEF